MGVSNRCGHHNRVQRGRATFFKDASCLMGHEGNNRLQDLPLISKGAHGQVASHVALECSSPYPLRSGLRGRVRVGLRRKAPLRGCAMAKASSSACLRHSLIASGIFARRRLPHLRGAPFFERRCRGLRRGAPFLERGYKGGAAPSGLFGRRYKGSRAERRF